MPSTPTADRPRTSQDAYQRESDRLRADLRTAQERLSAWEAEHPLQFDGAALRTQRHDINLTQKELAIIVGVSVSTISRLERGRTSAKCLPYTTFQPLLQVLGVDFHTLLHR